MNSSFSPTVVITVVMTVVITVVIIVVSLLRRNSSFSPTDNKAASDSATDKTIECVLLL